MGHIISGVGNNSKFQQFSLLVKRHERMLPTYVMCALAILCPLFFYSILYAKKNIHSEMKMFKFRPRRVSSVSGAFGKKKKKISGSKNIYLFFSYIWW